MLNININGASYPIKQTATDFTIKEYENLCEVLNDDNINEIDRYYQAFIMLGLDADLLDTFDGFSFLKLIHEFKDYTLPIGEFTKTIELNGRVYTSFDEKFFFSVKDMRLIEEYVKKNSVKFIGEILAIVFKDTELTKVEHYDPAHIKYKAKLFRENITYDVAIPFINDFSSNLITTLESFKN
jgi:hypothetical protein